MSPVRRFTIRRGHAAPTVLPLIVLLLLSLVVAGCGGGAPATTATPPPVAATVAAVPPALSTAAPAAGLVTIRVFAPQSPDRTDPYTPPDLTTNSFTRELEATFNIHFEWHLTNFDSPSAHQQRLTSLASGDYPDLYLLISFVDRFSQAELLQYGRQGVIVPLNDLIDQYAPNIKAALAKYPSFKTVATAPDGKIYGIPQINECYHCSYPNKLWINGQWLKKLNMPLPTTPEELRTVLQAFKTKDPNGNGQADEIPLSGSISQPETNVIPFLMNAFIYDDAATYLAAQNGKVDLAANKPEWKQGLAYIKSLYDAGLIDPKAFTQERDTFKQLGDHPGVQVLGAATAQHPRQYVTTGTPYSNAYVPLPPLRGPKVGYTTYKYPIASGATFVLTTKASKATQIATIKMLDYLFTVDGQIRGYFGEEGKDWRRPQTGDVALNQTVTPLVAEIPPQPGEPPRNTKWRALAQYFQPRAFRDGWVAATDTTTPAGYERRLFEATRLYDGKQPKEIFPYWQLWFDPAVADEAARLRASITENVEQSAALFATGAKDLDRDWDAYVQGLDRLGLPRYLALMQQAYDASAKR